MIRDGDPFAPLLQKFLCTNYEKEERVPDSTNAPSPYNPLTFFDRHIASNLLLKNIKYAPWIPTELGRICEETIKEFTAAGHTFVENAEYWKHFRNIWQVSAKSSRAVADYHFQRIGSPCNAFASKLLFHPEDPVWFSFIACRRSFSEYFDHAFYRTGDTGTVEPIETRTGEREYKIPPQTRPTLDKWVIPAIDKLEALQGIFNYEFFYKGKKAEDLLIKMGSCAQFRWEVPTATGASEPLDSSSPADSPIIRVLLPSLGALKPPASSFPKQSPTAKTSSRRRKVVAPLRSTQERESQYRLNVNHNIQKVVYKKIIETGTDYSFQAWARAVEKDATFIVFTCGRLERIGIRHRQSQTLYLSDLIDPARLEEPGYGQMHLGLVIAAIKDRLDMLDHLKTPGPTPRPSKRKIVATDSTDFYNSMKDKATRRKRRKLNPELEITSPEMDKKTFDDELAKRDLILIYFNHGILRSPSPSSFRRMEPSCVSRPFTFQSYHFKRKAFYSPESYISATLNSDFIGHGAVGLVYRAVVEIELKTGSKYRRNLILKLAIGRKKEQIIQEYEHYKRLAEAGVTHGIVGVHGLFHDMETGAMIMLMDDAGMSLRSRAIQDGHEILFDTCVDTTKDERDAFATVLEGIHSAHIIHLDLRIDNLMINEESEVFIIDFDSAEHDVEYGPQVYEDEMRDLLSVIGWEMGESTEDEDEDEE